MFVQKRMFFQDFSIQVYTGLDGAGDKKFDENLLNVKGYYVGNTKIVTSVTGEQIVSSGHFFVSAKDFQKITVGSMTTLPLEDGRFPIIHVEPFYKEYGALSYGVIYL